MNIVKASGEREAYSREKFCDSLKNTGVSEDLVNRVCLVVEKQVKEGMTTEEIFQKTAAALSKESPALAARYSLKRGIMDLGPSGFLFEQYIAAVLREYGYQTNTNQIIRGACVSHEIDIEVRAKDAHYFVEAKYHNSRGVVSDIQVVMYMHARLLDITEYHEKIERDAPVSHRAWLITNTRFTEKAIAYAKCKNIRITGWRYPRAEGLERLIEAKGLYPVTLLPGVNQYAKDQFAKRGIYFAKDLINFSPENFQHLFGIYQRAAKQIQQQAKELCV
ncbi:MAG: restriction endonuclease [Candidatus Wildermuthbacteria bacterium]|nr:restriction endonuclease [Candidatus Wildermuthbacteria bacterium]